MPLLANGIDLPLLLVGGLAILLPLLLFNAVVEAPVLSRFLQIPWGELYAPALRANIWSLLAGLLAALVNGAIAEAVLPEEFVARMQLLPWALALAPITYYLFSVGAEYLWFRRRMTLEATRGPLLKGLLVANLASYAVLGPAYWLLAQPKVTVREFTHDTAWAEQPSTRVVYRDPAGGLRSIQTDGSGDRVVLTNNAWHFVISENLETILFTTRSNDLHLARNGKTTKLPIPAFPVLAMGMDFSPDAELIGVVPVDSETAHILEVASGRAASLHLPEKSSWWRLTWSTNSSRFYIAGSKTNYAFEVFRGPVLRVKAAGSSTNLPPDLLEHYGLISSGLSSKDGTYDVDFRHLSFPQQKAGVLMMYYAGGGLRARHENHQLTVAENAGLWHFGNRQFHQAGFTGTYDEVVFHDGQNLYLGSLTRQKVGRIAAGTRFLLFSPVFSKARSPLR